MCSSLMLTAYSKILEGLRHPVAIPGRLVEGEEFVLEWEQPGEAATESRVA